jgi:hypothetical protein
LQCIVPGIEGALAPLEYAANLTALRPLLGLGIGKAGLGVPDPSDTACDNLIALQLITGALTGESLV